MQPRIYLAGPTCFLHNSRELYNDLKERCLALGMVGLSPCDTGSAPAAGTIADARAIRDQNLELIRSCDAVLADLRPFRGPSADCGTVYECGYASALKKPVVAYHVWQDITYRDKVLAGITQDRAAIESFDLFDNLMLAAGLHSAHEAPEEAINALATLMCEDLPQHE
jgi:nucleoside 2-deoxyribosyltransferase